MTTSVSSSRNKNTIKHKAKNPAQTPVTKITADAKSLIPFIDAIIACNTKCFLHIDNNQLQVRVVDNGNCYMVLAECECKADIPEGAPVKVAADVALIKKTLIHAKDCRITISIDGINISIEYGRFTAKIPVSDSAQLRKEPNPPTIILDTKFEMPGKYLYDVCRTVSKDYGKVYFYAKNGVAFLAAHENDFCIKEVVGTCGKNSKARSLYSNNYLSAIAGIIKTTQCNVEVAIDHPVKITAEQNGCKFTFLLAHQIESD